MWKPNTNGFEEPDQHWIHVELHKSQGPDLVGFDALKKTCLHRTGLLSIHYIRQYNMPNHPDCFSPSEKN